MSLRSSKQSDATCYCELVVKIPLYTMGFLHPFGGLPGFLNHQLHSWQQLTLNAFDYSTGICLQLGQSNSTEPDVWYEQILLRISWNKKEELYFFHFTNPDLKISQPNKNTWYCGQKSVVTSSSSTQPAIKPGFSSSKMNSQNMGSTCARL